MAYKILTINPGSTSTKVALFHDMEQVKTLKLSHSAEEIARFASVADQLDWRLEIILDALKADGIELTSLDAVIGRGGLMRPIEGGVYRAMMAANSTSGGKPVTVNATFEIDGEVVGKKVIKYHNGVVMQTGMSPLLV